MAEGLVSLGKDLPCSDCKRSHRRFLSGLTEQICIFKTQSAAVWKTDWRKARTQIRTRVKNLMSQLDIIITWTTMMEVNMVRILRFTICFGGTADKTC